MSEYEPRRQADSTPDVLGQLRSLAERAETLQSSIERRSDELRDQLRTVTEAVELLYDDDAGARRRLHALRNEASYASAFDEPDPLVSVVIPTWDRTQTLIERAIPSALAQTHTNIEIIVVGDAAPVQTVQAMAALDDPRLVFHNLTIRGPYEGDPSRAWLASGTPGFNAGVALARGQWIAPLGDDDAFVAEHIERLLATAAKERLEFVYGRLRMILPDGTETLVGEFPPRLTQIGLQGALYLRGLSFLELELGHALFGKPNDWGLVHRMMRAGVRMGMVDEVSVDYWPSLRARTTNEPTIDPPAPPSPDAGGGELHARLLEVEARLLAERTHGDEVEAQLLDLYRRFNDIRDSRSWRITAPLRAMRQKSRSH